MLVVTRHQPADVVAFLDTARDAIAALAARPGFVEAAVARAVEEPDTYLVSIRWADTGSYRRSMSPIDTRLQVLPLYNSSIDQHGVFEVLYSVDADGRSTTRPSDLSH